MTLSANMKPRDLTQEEMALIAGGWGDATIIVTGGGGSFGGFGSGFSFSSSYDNFFSGYDNYYSGDGGGSGSGEEPAVEEIPEIVVTGPSQAARDYANFKLNADILLFNGAQSFYSDVLEFIDRTNEQFGGDPNLTERTFERALDGRYGIYLQEYRDIQRFDRYVNEQ